MIVLLPTNRPERLGHVLTQWRAQTYTRAELVVCPSPGMVRPADLPDGVAWLAGVGNIGDARNLGLAYARMRGHEWAVFWDDDNHYGADYLAEVARNQSGVDVLSKGIAFVRHDSGLWKYERPLTFCPGHATATRVSAAADFPPWSLSEDVEWTRRMRARGAVVAQLPPWGLVYYRTGTGHAYDASEVEFLRAHGPARSLGDLPDAFADQPPAEPYSWPTQIAAQDGAVFLSLERRARIRVTR
jgi:hypothetical protein